MHNKVREPLFHIVKRDTLPWYRAWGIRALAIVLALLLCALGAMSGKENRCPVCGGPLKQVGAGTQRVQEDLKRLWPEVRTLRMDADTTQEMLLPAFKHNHHNPELKNKILACSSTENNLRMYSQYSNFTVHNSLERLEDICDENMLYKIIIPSGRKQYFIESLRVFGISESFVYPDLDHISSDLKDSYGI